MNQSSDYAVAFAVHEAYAGPTAVAASSILANSPGSFHFYILDLGLSDKSRAQLEKVLGVSRTTFVYLTQNMSLEGLALSQEVHVKRLGKEMYAKMYLAELLIKERERFLYLDCDTLTVGDLSPLFDLQLEPFAVGAVSNFFHPRVDSLEGLPDFRALGLPPNTPCLDSGMLVIDTLAFTERRIGRHALDYGRSHGSLSLGDLNALNAALRGEWRPLGGEWNFQVFEELRETYNGSAPIIYHFSGRYKPFLLGSKFRDMQIMYDEYRRLSIAAGGPPF
jgi:UDP-glucose/galactose:(glucosyl)LPS alpha-1,2-glucosyl/galactosyltransferase